MYKYSLFDLDETLTDPEIGITNGVLYGFGDREELEQAGADYIAEHRPNYLKF